MSYRVLMDHSSLPTELIDIILSYTDNAVPKYIVELRRHFVILELKLIFSYSMVYRSPVLRRFSQTED